MVRGQRFETLDGMRGLCALIVAVYHAGYFLHVPQFPAHGWLGVDMFFVLSGFVIALTYEERLLSGMGLANFLMGRAKRLLPIQTVGTLVCALSIIPFYWMHHELQFVAAVVSTILLIPYSWLGLADIFPEWRGIFPVNLPLWSLQGEWIINFLYAAFLYRWKSIFIVVAAAVSGALIIYSSSTGIGFVAPELGLERATFGFLLGVHIFRNRQLVVRVMPKISPLLVYACWFLASCFYFPIPYQFQIVPGGFLAAILVMVLVKNERPMGRVWVFLGRISYPLYASHFAILNILMLMWPAFLPHSQLWAIPILAVQIALATILEKMVRLRRRSVVLQEQLSSAV